MSNTQAKIIRHKMRQEDTTHNEEDNQSIETDLELTSVFELEDSDVKIVVKLPSRC